MPTPKEYVYDTKISPLVDQILEICREHNIAIIIDAALGFTEDDKECQLKVSSALLIDECEPSPEMFDAMDCLIPKGHTPA